MAVNAEGSKMPINLFLAAKLEHYEILEILLKSNYYHLWWLARASSEASDVRCKELLEIYLRDQWSEDALRDLAFKITSAKL